MKTQLCFFFTCSFFRFRFFQASDTKNGLMFNEMATSSKPDCRNVLLAQLLFEKGDVKSL